MCEFLTPSPQTFSREELTDDSDGLEVQVRVNNTQQGIVTFWTLEKFEGRLEVMRDMYTNMSTSGIGSSTSLEGESVGSSCEEPDPFSDPSDSWVKESLITPQPSPMRYVMGIDNHAVIWDCCYLPPKIHMHVLFSWLIFTCVL